MATKYQAAYQQMVDDNQEIFSEFKGIHDLYVVEPKTYQTQYNQVGETIMDLIQKYENRLCGKSERSGYGQYSSKLSEKFWERIRKDFPQIDSVGLIQG